MPWEEAVELTARGLATLIRRAMGNCITVRPVTIIQAAGAEPRIWLTHHVGYILRLLETNGYVSHTYTKRVGGHHYTYYVLCRSRNPNTDGHFNEDKAQWLWEAARAHPPEEAVKLIAGLITKLDAMAQS
jgi:hypothetical protein